MGSDVRIAHYIESGRFQSTLPAWGATAALGAVGGFLAFQSTLPAWGATARATGFSAGYEISIHAPRMGSDRCRLKSLKLTFNFNPRSPHGERRLYHSQNVIKVYFNPRSPHGERRIEGKHTIRTKISIHAPRMGSDTFGLRGCIIQTTFQSTLPAWGATYLVCFFRWCL